MEGDMEGTTLEVNKTRPDPRVVRCMSITLAGGPEHHCACCVGPRGTTKPTWPNTTVSRSMKLGVLGHLNPVALAVWAPSVI